MPKCLGIGALKSRARDPCKFMKIIYGQKVQVHKKTDIVINNTEIKVSRSNYTLVKTEMPIEKNTQFVTRLFTVARDRV